MPVALAAACLLVLQTALGAFAFGGGAQGVQLDAFGNVICTQEGAVHLPDGGQDRTHSQGCCTLGCTFAAGGPATPPTAFALANPLGAEIRAFHFSGAPALPAGHWRPWSNPRAPPAVA